jgi:hypothetical protein
VREPLSALLGAAQIRLGVDIAAAKHALEHELVSILCGDMSLSRTARRRGTQGMARILAKGPASSVNRPRETRGRGS